MNKITKKNLISQIIKYRVIGELSANGLVETFEEDGLIIDIYNLPRRAYTYSFLTLYNNSRITNIEKN